MTLFSVLNDLFFALTIISLGFSLPFFIVFRRDPVFRQRSYALEGLWWLMNLGQAIRFRYVAISIETGNPWPCIATIWASGIQTPAWAFAGLIRCVRLFLLYSITKEKFRLDQIKQESEGEDGSQTKTVVPTLSHWWLDEKYLHWKYMYTAYALLVLVYQIFPIVTTIAGLAINDGEVPSQFCKSVPGRAGTIGTMGSLAIVILFCAWKMRHVHDAYFLKKELTFLGIETLFVAAPALTATFLTIWGWVPSMATVFVYSATSFLIPALLVVRKKVEEHTTKGSSSEFSEETPNSRQSKIEKPKIDGFHEHPRIQKLLSNPAALPWIQEYLVHYQDFELSNQLLCWTNIVKFRDGGNSGVAGRAWLLYKKFIESNSYIKVSCISEESRNSLATILSAEIQEEKRPESTEITVDVFNDIMLEVEESLAEKLFKSFFRSEFFVRHQEELALKIGMEV